ncbi:MAG: hypothetical protein JWQ34_131 [Mucilaginibacter sp.]|uniref:hypothetical protein n=1 Tax=Mucilaginibacter sp. TaxID=1882438 RepID=UPI002617B0F1|nr:hypothetical protein [Mucilaginibacter sp.]MDB5001906.1 hypothetical protein [Mucilaginibacter sp.]
MKNLNRTIKKATMPKLSPVTSVNRKFLYSLCAALFLLTCSLSTKAQDGTQADPDTVTLGFEHKDLTACTSCSPLINNYGDATHSGTDRWIKITLIDDGYLTINGGTSDFDSVFYLLGSDESTLLTSGDDGAGSGDNNDHIHLQPLMQYYASAGTYYLVVDGTDKYIGYPSSWTSTSGTVGIYLALTHF